MADQPASSLIAPQGQECQERQERQERQIQLGIMIAFLRAGARIDQASSILLLTSCLFVLSAPGLATSVAAIIALGCAMVEKYFAWRVMLDADLFALLARFPEQEAADASFDAALSLCTGRERPPTPRTLQSRWVGARRLLLRQIGMTVAQVACLAALLV